MKHEQNSSFAPQFCHQHVCIGRWDKGRVREEEETQIKWQKNKQKKSKGMEEKLNKMNQEHMKLKGG